MYKNNKVYNIDKDKFIEIVKTSNNVTDALRKIGYTNPRAGRSRSALMKRIEELSIDTSHFSMSKKRFPITARSIEETFVANAPRNNQHLKLLIMRHNLKKYECVECGNTGEWNGKPLALHLDHIDGDNTNNELENLRFLCPNCHSQTETYAGKKRNT